MDSLLIASLFFFLTIAILRLDLAVFLITALLPAYLLRFNVLGVPLTFLEAMILISFAVWFLKNVAPNLKTWLKNRQERTPYPFGWEIIAIIIISFVAIAVAGFNASALGIWKAYFFEPILLFILVMNVLPGDKGRQKILLALLLGAAAVSLWGLFQQATGFFIFNPFWADASTRRVVSFFGYPNAVGLYLAPLVLIFSGWLLSIKGWESKETISKLIIGLVILISLLTIYFAKSEGAIIGILAGAFLCLFFANRKTRIASIGLAAIVIIAIFIIPTLKTYASDKILLHDLSGEIRRRQWTETMMSLKDWKVITGNGLSAYQTAVAPYHQEGIFFNRDKIENFDAKLRASAELRAKYWQPVEIYMYPHNIFLNFWSELGILGALAFTWLIGKYLFISLNLFFQKKNYLILGLFGAMAVIVVHGLVDVPYFKNDLSAMFFVFLALLGSLTIEAKIKKI
ncbi:MAG: O-antigen ligase family protein [Candidatus Falkowbacteria bacterium]|nr:MAG: O-antigen ligase family protein [Candidatus Falkowbacteria bacterium]